MGRVLRSKIPPATHLEITILLKLIVAPSAFTDPNLGGRVHYRVTRYPFVQIEQLFERMYGIAVGSLTRRRALIKLSTVATSPIVKEIYDRSW